MKAIICEKYGPPETVKLAEVDKPTPGDDEVLVRVYASSVNFGNVALIKGEPLIARLWSGLRQPKDKIPGSDVAGRVEAVGRNITRFKPGDEVFGDTSECGFGAYAEYVTATEAALVHKPANLSYEEAAATPQAALVALQGLRDIGHIRAGQKVLVVAAAGGNGSFAVQIAKAYGAEVTAVCGPDNVELVRTIGADHVIDYTKEDFSRNGQQYDLILAANGYNPIAAYKRALSPNGIYVMAGGSMAQVFQALLLGPLLSMNGSKKLTNLMQHVSQEDMVYMKELFEAGKVKPVIDRCYSLHETAEALRYYEKGHARGKVVIIMKNEEL
jgi:NADPH:quinone reductase-like Zn-dependent oxidoreductase